MNIAPEGRSVCRKGIKTLQKLRRSDLLYDDRHVSTLGKTNQQVAPTELNILIRMECYKQAAPMGLKKSKQPCSSNLEVE